MNWLSIAIQHLIDSNRENVIIGNPPFVARLKRKRPGYYYTPRVLLRKEVR